jgi:hypothetical protein
MVKLKEFLVNVMKPSIREFLHYVNPDELESWQYNCCRQTSLIANWYLRQWLLNNKSGYKEVQSWVGKFRDIIADHIVLYDHAWIYCVHEDPRKNLLIDIGRNHKPSMFAFTPVNEYPRNYPGYESMICFEKKRLNEEMLWDYPEHFTGKTIKEIVPKLSWYMQQQSIARPVRRLHRRPVPALHNIEP